jgi:hypothetical protein
MFTDLRKDKEIVIAAIKQNKSAFDYVISNLKTDTDILEEFNRKN